MSKNEPTTIAFHGASLIVIRGATPADTLVAMKPVVEGMGLDWEGQRQRIMRHPVLSKGACEMQVPSAGGIQAMTGLPLSRLSFWLATIQTTKLPNPDIRQRIIRYQEECADVLFDHFFGKATGVDDLARRTDGIARMLAHKVAGIEKVVGLMAEAMARQDSRSEDLAEQVRAMIIAADPRVAVGAYLSLVEVLDAEGVPPKKRNNINRRLGHAFRERCLKDGIQARRCARTGTWLFPVADVHKWMTAFGRTMIRGHLDGMAGQGALKLVSPKND